MSPNLAMEILPTPEDAAARAAFHLARAAKQAIDERGRCLMALSGGKTPVLMLELFAEMDLPWQAVHVFQVDERFAPPGSGQRNFSALQARLGQARLYPMPVEAQGQEAAKAYARLVFGLAQGEGLDLVQLGLGADGHTASIFPQDAGNPEIASEVFITPPRMGLARMSLGLGLLNQARERLWLVTGSDKAPALACLVKGGQGIPAGRIRREAARVVADQAAAAKLEL